jgi:hypothetical protein
MNPLHARKAFRFAPALLLLVSAGASAAVDPSLLDLVTPDTKVLYGIQVQQTLASAFGQYALSQLPTGGAGMLQFATATGFDLKRDLHEILVASPSPAAGSTAWNASLILARGTFQADKFTALAQITGASVTAYRGFQIVTPQQPGNPSFTFLDSSTLAIGIEPVLQNTIDRRAARSTFSGPLVEKAQIASSVSDAWFATVTPLAQLVPSGSPVPATIIDAVAESWGSLHFDESGVTITAEALTHSASEAKALADVLRIVAAMVKGPQAPQIQNAQFSADGQVTRVTLTIPEQYLERSFVPGPRAIR